MPEKLAPKRKVTRYRYVDRNGKQVKHGLRARFFLDGESSSLVGVVKWKWDELPGYVLTGENWWGMIPFTHQMLVPDLLPFALDFDYIALGLEVVV